MTENWITLRPIRSTLKEGDFFDTPRRLSDRLTVKMIPDFIKDPSTLKMYTDKVVTGITTARLAICAEYSAEALGSQDPDGPEGTGIHQNIANDLILLPLAFWISGTPLIVANEILHVRREAESGILRQLVSENPIFIRQDEGNLVMTEEKFNESILLFEALKSLPPKGNSRLAMWSTYRAIREDQWALRFLMFWLSLEGLFGPADGKEICHRLSQRIAYFLEETKEKALTRFQSVKSGYGWRSKIVHGMRLEKLKPEKSAELMKELEDNVRCCLKKVLLHSNREQFDKKDRETFLETLAFEDWRNH